MEQITLVLALAGVFYVLIPGAGAFAVRNRWRRFRRRLTEASRLRQADYSQLRRSSTVPDGERLGSFRFFGTLEAIQGNDTIWLKDGRVSFACSMTRVTVFLLPAGGMLNPEEAGGYSFPDDTPSSVRWDTLSSLTEGTGIFVAGSLYAMEGKPTFRDSDEERLLVILYDGAPRTLLRRSIWSGRQRNEYWNQLTPASLAAGTLSLGLSAYLFLRGPLLRLPAILGLGFSVVPVLPLFPPAVPLFFLYRGLWKRGRIFRAQRDLLRLPLRYFNSDRECEAELPDGERYGWKQVGREEAMRLVRRGAVYQDVPRGSGGDGFPTYRVYGAFDDDRENAAVRKPEDPMAELVVVPGNPARLSKSAQRRARWAELAAVAAFVSGLGMNLYLALVLLSRVIH
jgi:hypothetical protein